ncbi:hypothetical protein [Ekhidna sp.]|uniref:hypothetical protein n=1 Tax=Ekhidna sp. TaxID=2608089 RepID=UPI003CCBBC2E
MKRFTVSILSIMICLSVFAQERLVVFDKEGRIIKNDGFNKADGAYTVRFMIEGVTQDETDNYFILHQNRNDHLYKSNNTFEPHNTESFIYRQGYMAESIIQVGDRGDDAELIDYLLIRVNDSLANWIRLNIRMGTVINAFVLQQHSLDMFLNRVSAIDYDDIVERLNSIATKEAELSALNNQKMKEEYNESFQELLTEISFTKKQLELLREHRSSLPKEKEKCCPIEELKKISEEIKMLEEQLLDQNKDVLQTKKDHDKKIIDKKKEINKSKSDLKKALAESIGTGAMPSIHFLHQGTLIVFDENIHEISYNAYEKKIDNSNKTRISLGRWTPDLPQLNTASQLYLHIFNLTPDVLKSDPFTIELSSELSEEVTIESPSNFQGLQEADLGFDFSSVLGKMPFSDGFVFLSERHELPVGFDSDKIKNLYTLIKTIEIEPRYIDYILKYPTPFKPLREVTLDIKRNQYTTDSFEQKVEKGDLKKENFTIKYQSETLAKDVLPAVHRLYRFSLNTGIVYSNRITYNYRTEPIGSSSQLRLIEEKNTNSSFRPILTFSTYLIKNQDTAIDPEGFWGIMETIHLDFGLDYAQKNVFDDVYLGLGFEPKRSIHLAGGVKISQLEKVDINRLDPITLNIADALRKETEVSGYFSLNLGVSLIPTVLKNLTK